MSTTFTTRERFQIVNEGKQGITEAEKKNICDDSTGEKKRKYCAVLATCNNKTQHRQICRHIISKVTRRDLSLKIHY